MAQLPSKRWSQGDHLDYTPSSAVAAGDVIAIDGVHYIAERAIAANTLGAVAATGTFLVPKTNAAIAAGVELYWDPAATPVGATGGETGAVTSTAGALAQIGRAGLAGAADTAATVVCRLGVA